MKTQSTRPKVLAVCIDNSGYLASLEAGKLYQIVPDTEAGKQGLIRVIDESGEDHGYSVDRFFILEVPDALEKALKRIFSPSRQPNGFSQNHAANEENRMSRNSPPWRRRGGSAHQ